MVYILFTETSACDHNTESKNVKTHNKTTQKTKKMSNTDPQKTGGELRCPRKVSSSYFL